jgi:hypothetical protein
VIEGDDRLHAEVDRQLGEIRSDCDGLATRAGVLLTATGIVATIVAARFDKVPKLRPTLAGALLALGIAVTFGILTVVPWLRIAPRASLLQRWMSVASSPRTSSLLYDTKVALLAGGAVRLLVMRTFFVLQALATIVTIVLGLSYSMGR